MNSQTNGARVDISKIKKDTSILARVELDTIVIDEYTEAMQNGVEFPPVVIFDDGETYWLADGFHRVYAAIEAEKQFIEAERKKGTRRDAILYAVGANATHGLQRSNADKRKAVLTLLEDEEWQRWSDNEIAKHAAVSQPFVGKLRKELTNNG